MLRTLTRILPALAAVALLACAKEAADDATEMADTTAMEEPTPGISLANLAGTWNMRTMPMDSDTTQIEYTITIDEAGWTMLLPERDPVTSNVTVEGDSVVAVSAPFESVLRGGVMVTTTTVYRMEGDRLVGTITARYETTGPDSVTYLRTEGTRAP